MQSLTLDWSQASKDFLRSPKLQRAVATAVFRAGTDAARFMRSGASRLLRQKKRFKVSLINHSILLLPPRSRTDVGLMEWQLLVRGTPVKVADFSYRQIRKGVSARINVGKRSLMKGAFVARLKSGHEGVFRRIGRARLPIEELYTTRVSDVFRDRDFIPYLFEGTQAKFAQAFAKRLEGIKP